jgi:hypothetical protein
MVAFVEGYPRHRSYHGEQRSAKIGSVTNGVTWTNFSGPYKTEKMSALLDRNSIGSTQTNC